jgi:sucrose porin
MMKAYMLTLCALALPASAAAADTTLNEINARLERLEAELKQSRIQLQDATRKIDAAEKERPAPKNAARAQERLQFVEQQTEQDLAQIKANRRSLLSHKRRIGRLNSAATRAAEY